jgi:hypothetical protein
MQQVVNRPIETMEKQTTELEEIQAALWEQSFARCGVKVSCGMGQVVAIARRKGQLRAMFRGWKRWHEIKSVTISRPAYCSTGGCEILDDL